MTVIIPELSWPGCLKPSGPKEDPLILLNGISEIGGARHLIYALRVDPYTLEVDLRRDLDASVYADQRLDVMLEELLFFADFDRTAAVSLDQGNYVFWMVPWNGSGMPTPGI